MKNGVGVARLVALGIAVTACKSTPPPQCPAPNTTFQPVNLASGLADWDGAKVAFDGTSVWIAYSVAPAGSGQSSNIFVSHLGCDGTLVDNPNGSAAPMQINLGLAAGRAPAMAASSTDFLAAWAPLAGVGASPDQTGGAVYQTFPVDDTSAPGDPSSLELTLGNQPSSGNVLVSGLTAQGGGTGAFLLAGARSSVAILPVDGGTPATDGGSVDAGPADAGLADAGPSDAGTSGTDGGSGSNACNTVFLQWTSTEGIPLSAAASDVEPAEAVAGCVTGSPQAVAGGANDPVYLVWEQVPTGGPQALLFARLQPDASRFDSAIALASGTMTDFSASSGISSGSSDTAPEPSQYVAVITQPAAGSANLLVQEITHQVSGARPISALSIPLQLGTPGSTDGGTVTSDGGSGDMDGGTDAGMTGPAQPEGTASGRPVVAGSTDGGAVAWTVTMPDNTTKMFLQRFTNDGTSLQATGNVFDLGAQANSTAGRVEALAHLGGTSYAVVWSDPPVAGVVSPRSLRAGIITLP